MLLANISCCNTCFQGHPSHVMTCRAQKKSVREQEVYPSIVFIPTEACPWWTWIVVHLVFHYWKWVQCNQFSLCIVSIFVINGSVCQKIHGIERVMHPLHLLCPWLLCLLFISHYGLMDTRVNISFVPCLNCFPPDVACHAHTFSPWTAVFPDWETKAATFEKAGCIRMYWTVMTQAYINDTTKHC